MTSKFDCVLVVLEESINLVDLKIEELQGSLEAHELRIKELSHEKAIEQGVQEQIFKKMNGDGRKFKNGKEKWKESSDKGDLKRQKEDTCKKGGGGYKGNKKKKFNKRMFNANILLMSVKQVKALRVTTMKFNLSMQMTQIRMRFL